MIVRSACLDALTSLGTIPGRKPLGIPRTLQLNICDCCNLDCIMYYRYCIPDGWGMLFETIHKFAGGVYSLGLHEIYFRCYDNPFIHPQILEIFDSDKYQLFGRHYDDWIPFRDTL